MRESTLRRLIFAQCLRRLIFAQCLRRLIFAQCLRRLIFAQRLRRLIFAQRLRRLRIFFGFSLRRIAVCDTIGVDPSSVGTTMPILGFLRF